MADSIASSPGHEITDSNPHLRATLIDGGPENYKKWADKYDNDVKAWIRGPQKCRCQVAELPRQSLGAGCSQA